MLNQMMKYYPFRTIENTPIIVDFYHGNKPVESHQHRFAEFVYIKRGSCVHHYKNSEVLLVPGDVFIIPPYNAHSFKINAEVTIYNCQYYPDKISHEWNEMYNNLILKESQKEKTKKDYEDILRNMSMISSESTKHVADINSQGIIHLSTKEIQNFETMLSIIRDEQIKKRIGYEYVKRYTFGLILITLRRVMAGQYKDNNNFFSEKRKIIEDCFNYIEAHLSEKIDFGLVAKNINLSQNYFRTVFKDVTGLSPNNYLNRLRIVRSLEFLQLTNCSIADAAAQVGIFDANYFSRLFKKIMGYSPRYFKNNI